MKKVLIVLLGFGLVFLIATIAPAATSVQNDQIWTSASTLPNGFGKATFTLTSAITDNGCQRAIVNNVAAITNTDQFAAVEVAVNHWTDVYHFKRVGLLISQSDVNMRHRYGYHWPQHRL